MSKVLVTLGFEDMIMDVEDAATLFIIVNRSELVNKTYKDNGYGCEVLDKKLNVTMSTEKINISRPEPESPSEPEPEPDVPF